MSPEMNPLEIKGTDGDYSRANWKALRTFEPLNQFDITSTRDKMRPVDDAGSSSYNFSETILKNPLLRSKSPFM